MCTITVCEKRFNNHIPSLLRNLKLFDKYAELFNNYKLPINGNDIITYFKLTNEEKPLIKEYLNYLYDYMFASGILLSNKEECYEKIQKYKSL